MDSDTYNFFNTILEHTSEAIFLINASGTIIFSAKESNKELEGQNFLDSISKMHHRRVKKAITDAFESRKPVACELKGWFSALQASWFSCRISPVLKRGKTSSALVFTSDITRRRSENLAYRKKINNKLRKSEKRLRAVENLLTMCAKTKKIRFEGDWLSIEQFLWKRYGFKISHGLSPEAVDEELRIIDENHKPVNK